MCQNGAKGLENSFNVGLTLKIYGVEEVKEKALREKREAREGEEG